MQNDMTKREIILRGDRTLTVEDIGERSTLRIVAPTGEVELTLEVGALGPTLRLRAVNLAIEAQKDLTISAESVTLRAAGQLRLESGGDVTAIAQSGSMQLRANDDVAVDAERILLNSPTTAPAKTWEEFGERVVRDEDR